MGRMIWCFASFGCVVCAHAAEIQEAVGPVAPKSALAKRTTVHDYLNLIQGLQSNSASPNLWMSLDSATKRDIIWKLDKSQYLLFKVIGPVAPIVPKPPAPTPTPPKPSAPPPDTKELMHRLEGIELILKGSKDQQKPTGLTPSEDQELLKTLKSLERGAQR